MMNLYGTCGAILFPRAADCRRGAEIRRHTRHPRTGIARALEQPGNVMKQLSTVVTLILFCFCLSASAQPVTQEPEEPLPRYGVAGHVGLNFHAAGFRALPGIPNCCQQFESGASLGWDLGLLYELPFSQQWWLGIRAGYSSESATLTATEPTTVILIDRNEVTGKDSSRLVEGEFEHTIDGHIGTIGVEPMISFRPAPRLALYLGGNIAYVLQRNYDQKEEIIKPENRGVFVENLQRVRNVFSGEIPDAASIIAGVVVGAGFELPLNSDGTMLLAPELMATFGLTNLVADSTWRPNSIRLGAALKYAPRPEPEPVAPPVEPPPAEPEAPLLVANVSAVGVGADGIEQQAFRLQVEEFISVSMRPLLNYVFFPEGSARIPDRYVEMSPEQAASFDLAGMHDVPTLPTYYQMLNIIGRRMKDHPEATLRLVGTNADTGAERRNLDLSRQRAEAVRDYLRDVWDVAESRLKVEARNLPEKFSNPGEADGVAENRRVEIYASDRSILEPVVTNDTLRTANPPVIKFRPEVTAEAGVTGWRLAAMQDGRELKEFSGNGPVPGEIVWEVNEDQEGMPRIPTPVDFVLDVRDNAGQGVTSPQGSLPVEQITIRRKRQERVADKEIDRYSLILFDFDKADLNDANTRIARWVKERIAPGATVEIVGSTDRTGEAGYNARLSAERARNVAKLIGAGDVVRGIGESDLYDNDLPEGRFYCRTVSIVVETPVQ